MESSGQSQVESTTTDVTTTNTQAMTSSTSTPKSTPFIDIDAPATPAFTSGANTELQTPVDSAPQSHTSPDELATTVAPTITPTPTPTPTPTHDDEEDTSTQVTSTVVSDKTTNSNTMATAKNNNPNLTVDTTEVSGVLSTSHDNTRSNLSPITPTPTPTPTPTNLDESMTTTQVTSTVVSEHKDFNPVTTAPVDKTKNNFAPNATTAANSNMAANIRINVIPNSTSPKEHGSSVSSQQKSPNSSVAKRNSSIARNPGRNSSSSKTQETKKMDSSTSSVRSVRTKKSNNSSTVSTSKGSDRSKPKSYGQTPTDTDVGNEEDETSTQVTSTVVSDKTSKANTVATTTTKNNNPDLTVDATEASGVLSRDNTRSNLSPITPTPTPTPTPTSLDESITTTQVTSTVVSEHTGSKTAATAPVRNAKNVSVPNTKTQGGNSNVIINVISDSTSPKKRENSFSSDQKTLNSSFTGTRGRNSSSSQNQGRKSSTSQVQERKKLNNSNSSVQNVKSKKLNNSNTVDPGLDRKRLNISGQTQLNTSDNKHTNLLMNDTSFPHTLGKEHSNVSFVSGFTDRTTRSKTSQASNVLQALGIDACIADTSFGDLSACDETVQRLSDDDDDEDCVDNGKSKNDDDHDDGKSEILSCHDERGDAFGDDVPLQSSKFKHDASSKDGGTPSAIHFSRFGSNPSLAYQGGEEEMMTSATKPLPKLAAGSTIDQSNSIMLVYRNKDSVPGTPSCTTIKTVISGDQISDANNKTATTVLKFDTAAEVIYDNEGDDEIDKSIDDGKGIDDEENEDEEERGFERPDTPTTPELEDDQRAEVTYSKTTDSIFVHPSAGGKYSKKSIENGEKNNAELRHHSALNTTAASTEIAGDERDGKNGAAVVRRGVEDDDDHVIAIVPRRASKDEANDMRGKIILARKEEDEIDIHDDNVNDDTEKDLRNKESLDLGENDAASLSNSEDDDDDEEEDDDDDDDSTSQPATNFYQYKPDTKDSITHNAKTKAPEHIDTPTDRPDNEPNHHENKPTNLSITSTSKIENNIVADDRDRNKSFVNVTAPATPAFSDAINDEDISTRQTPADIPATPVFSATPSNSDVCQDQTEMTAKLNNEQLLSGGPTSQGARKTGLRRGASNKHQGDLESPDGQNNDLLNPAANLNDSVSTSVFFDSLDVARKNAAKDKNYRSIRKLMDGMDNVKEGNLEEYDDDDNNEDVDDDAVSVNVGHLDNGDTQSRGREKVLKLTPRSKKGIGNDKDDDDDEDEDESEYELDDDDFDSFGSQDIELLQRGELLAISGSATKRAERNFPIGVDGFPNKEVGVSSSLLQQRERMESGGLRATLHRARPISRSATDLRPQRERSYIIEAKMRRYRPLTSQTGCFGETKDQNNTSSPRTKGAQPSQDSTETSGNTKSTDKNQTKSQSSSENKKKAAELEEKNKKENDQDSNKNKENQKTESKTKSGVKGNTKKDSPRKGGNETKTKSPRKEEEGTKGNKKDQPEEENEEVSGGKRSGELSSRSSNGGTELSEGRSKQREFFKNELHRLESSLKRESSKIIEPEKKPHTPFIFNTLEPYYNTRMTRFLVELPDEMKHGHTSRRTAQGLTDPWLDLKMDRDILPRVASKPVSRQVAILKKEKEIRDRKKRSAINQSGTSRKEGSTRLPKFPMVQLETQDLAVKQLSYGDVPGLRTELKSKYSSSARAKIDEDYKRTHADFYRMELDKLDEVHPINRGHMKSAYFAYLQNTPGSKKAINECVRGMKSGKAQ